MPFPNYAVLGPNVAHLHANGVVGIFEEGAYWARGSDLEAMKSYVLAKALWDPKTDSAANAKMFVQGYYGKAAAPHVFKYIQAFEASVNETAFYMGESVPVTSAYLDCATVLKASQEIAAGVAATASDAPRNKRVAELSLTTRYVGLLRWKEMQACPGGLQWCVESSPPIVRACRCQVPSSPLLCFVLLSPSCAREEDGVALTLTE